MTTTKMRVRIDPTGNHLDGDGNPYPDGWVHMVVNDGGGDHGFLVDLSKVRGKLIDPTTALVTLGPEDTGRRGGDGFVIIEPGIRFVRHDGYSNVLWDLDLIEPYLDAWRERRAELLG